MTAPTDAALDLAAALAKYRAGLREVSDAELDHRASAVAALPGWFAGELRRLVDDERVRRAAVRPAPNRSLRIAVGTVVTGAPAAVLTGTALTEYADRVPQVLVYSPAVAAGLVAAVVGGIRLGRWIDDRRRPLAVDIDEADLNPLGKELLARVRAQRQARGEVC
ncbi:hypothetical protein [Micromonospora sp. CA-246542]|uniref:hypothetical protein n=1 Tax=Micromonospora sp. CA-246542 TaxID=3239959 RepID=UPI003D93069A